MASEPGDRLSGRLRALRPRPGLLAESFLRLLWMHGPWCGNHALPSSAASRTTANRNNAFISSQVGGVRRPHGPKRARSRRHAAFRPAALGLSPLGALRVPARLGRVARAEQPLSCIRSPAAIGRSPRTWRPQAGKRRPGGRRVVPRTWAWLGCAGRAAASRPRGRGQRGMRPRPCPRGARSGPQDCPSPRRSAPPAPRVVVARLARRLSLQACRSRLATAWPPFLTRSTAPGT